MIRSVARCSLGWTNTCNNKFGINDRSIFRSVFRSGTPFDNWSIARLQRFQLMTSAEDNVADIGVAFELIKLIALRFFFLFFFF